MIETDMGGVIEGWEDRFTLWAHLRYLRGSEAVMQARLVSKAPVIITVRRSAQSEGITSEWRAVIGSVIFDLKEAPAPARMAGSWKCWRKREVAAESQAADHSLRLSQPRALPRRGRRHPLWPAPLRWSVCNLSA